MGGGNLQREDFVEDSIMEWKSATSARDYFSNDAFRFCKAADSLLDNDRPRQRQSSANVITNGGTMRKSKKRTCDHAGMFKNCTGTGAREVVGTMADVEGKSP